MADHTRTFRNLSGTGTILVFFKEAGVAPFFRHPLHELFRKSISLDNFLLRSELLCLEERLVEAPAAFFAEAMEVIRKVLPSTEFHRLENAVSGPSQPRPPRQDASRLITR